MWPRLVANKVLRKRSGSSNFVADAPTTTTAAVDALLPELIPADDPNTAIFTPHHAKPTSTTYRVFVSTWNVGGIVPHDDLDMEEILDTCNTPCDIYVLGHLASGGTQQDERNRNSDLSDIFTRTTFPTGRPCLNLPKTILNHDRVIFLGDLNYRISLPEETTRLLVETRDWNPLLENDQLRMQLMKGQFLGGWKEGNVTFPPTYKYQLNSDLYFGLFQPRTGHKSRSPAWCDRIIWFGEGMKQQLYTRCETKLSDHRPVKGVFTAQVGMLNTIKELETLLLSNRFETISSSDRLQLPETHNNFICKGRPSL